MSITECKQYIYDNFAQDYSREVILKYACKKWNAPGNINKSGYKNGVKKTSAGYDVTKGFTVWILKNVKPRIKKRSRKESG